MKILLYCPDLDGHRQVYASVLARLFLEMGHRVLVMALRLEKLDRWPYLANLAEEVGFLKIGPQEATVEVLVAAQAEQQVDLTVFVDGDGWLGEFARLASGGAPKLLGRNWALFIILYRWMPGEDVDTGKPIAPKGYLRRMVSSLKAVVRNGKPGLRPSAETLAHLFDKHFVPGEILERIFVLDERIVNRTPKHFSWFPDIYEEFFYPGGNSDPEQEQRHAEPFQAFLDAKKDKRKLLVFGSNLPHKRMDRLLWLAENDPESVLIHCGTFKREWASAAELQQYQRLLGQGKVYAFGEFVTARKIIDQCFGAIDYFVSARDFIGSSGTVLMALARGKPVITHDKGLEGFRTLRFGLGFTFRHSDLESLKAAWERAAQHPPGSFQENIDRFMRSFGPEKLKSCFSTEH